jgi:hypothetical protein
MLQGHSPEIDDFTMSLHDFGLPTVTSLDTLLGCCRTLAGHQAHADIIHSCDTTPIDARAREREREREGHATKATRRAKLAEHDAVSQQLGTAAQRDREPPSPPARAE